MHEKIEKLALDACLLNYVDNETPRRYFVHGFADLNDVQKFAELIIRECADIADMNQFQHDSVGKYIKNHFGVE